MLNIVHSQLETFQWHRTRACIVIDIGHVNNTIRGNEYDWPYITNMTFR